MTASPIDAAARALRAPRGRADPGHGRHAGAWRLDVGGQELDAVLASRPDLADGVRRALEAAVEVDDPIAWVSAAGERRPDRL